MLEQEAARQLLLACLSPEESLPLPSSLHSEPFSIFFILFHPFSKCQQVQKLKSSRRTSLFLLESMNLLSREGAARNKREGAATDLLRFGIFGQWMN